MSMSDKFKDKASLLKVVALPYRKRNDFIDI